MLKVILDYPISVFLFVVALILVSIFFICILPDKWTDSDIFMCVVASVWAVILIASIVATVIIFFSTKEPISNKAWKQVYTNDINASVEIDFESGEGEDYKWYSIKAGEDSSKNIQKLREKLDSDCVIYNVEITVTQGKNKLTKVVALTKDNFEKGKVDLSNALVSEIEYRPIEGFARKMFGESGTPEERGEVGEIKIKLGSSENKKLKKIFED